MNDIIKIRLQAWIYAGVDVELELADAKFGLAHEPEEKNYWRKSIDRGQAKLLMVNERIKDLEAKKQAIELGQKVRN